MMKMTPWEKKQEPATIAKNKEKGERTGTNIETGKSRREYELEKNSPKTFKKRIPGGENREKRRSLRKNRNRKRNFAHIPKKTQTRKAPDKHGGERTKNKRKTSE